MIVIENDAKWKEEGRKEMVPSLRFARFLGSGGRNECYVLQGKMMHDDGDAETLSCIILQPGNDDGCTTAIKVAQSSDDGSFGVGG